MMKTIVEENLVTFKELEQKNFDISQVQNNHGVKT